MRVPNLFSLPKVVFVLCLVGLGANGLIQVGLQHDMAAKTAKLQTQVAKAASLSGDMKASLNGIDDLEQATVHMSGTLSKLSFATLDMDRGLSTLSKTVSGLGDAIAQIDQSTNASNQKMTQAELAAKKLLQTLSQVADVNQQVITNLNGMVRDQAAINENLMEMNKKTQLLPN